MLMSIDQYFHVKVKDQSPSESPVRREAWDDEPTAWGDLSHYGRFTGGTLRRAKTTNSPADTTVQKGFWAFQCVGP